MWRQHLTWLAVVVEVMLTVAIPAAGRENRMDPLLAFRLAQSAKVLLVDIRAPREWRATGIPVPAHPLDMQDSSFSQGLQALTHGNK